MDSIFGFFSFEVGGWIALGELILSCLLGEIALGPGPVLISATPLTARMI